MKQNLFCLFFGLFSFQVLLGQEKPSGITFTRADSLRGGLSALRTCYDVKFYDLDLKVDPVKKFITGSNRITFKAVKNLDKLQLDLFSNMKIGAVLFKGSRLKFTREFNAFFVNFPQILTKDSLYTLEIQYSGNPQIAKRPPWDGGFTWSKDASGKPWIGVSCQGTGASLWWPNKDHQSDEPDSMMIRVSVPSGLQDISNGRLVNTVDMGGGYTRFDWFVKNPINNYDVTLNIGNYSHFSENFQDLSCDFYVLPEHDELARKQFLQVRTMLNAFLNYFGPYPFKEDGYKLIESPYLGMEHQSAIAYGNKFMNGYLGRDLSETGKGLSWDYIIVHESAHEWFGNNITTNDIADSWVHEGFAMYAEGLFVEYTQGYAAGQTYIAGLRNEIQNDRPVIGIYGVNQDGSPDMYPKGANLLNMVRKIINKDSLWFSILKSMNLDFRHQTVNGSDIINYICKKSKIDLHPVFYQYLNTTQIPVLDLKWSGQNTLKFRWTDCEKNFNMPIDILLNPAKTIRIFPVANKWQKLSLESKKLYPHIQPDTATYYIRRVSDPSK